MEEGSETFHLIVGIGGCGVGVGHVGRNFIELCVIFPSKCNGGSNSKEKRRIVSESIRKLWLDSKV